ncbi:MAG TPA: multidrug effflux MFS transporter [Rhabdochlamydiaceae bacterium]|nr:multidrug effflux MFS transporter [Rhabdochlamydiaceae bacterium]
MSDQKPPLILLLLLVSFGSVGAVLFTPALPAISQYFHVSVGHSQLTMTSYLIGYALGQLPYGPVANAYGRKKTLYFGLWLSIIGSLLCAFSSLHASFNLLIFARFLQALGATVGLKISYTMVADTHEPSEATRTISKFVLAFAIMPGIGIAIGGFLTQWLGWQSCFYFLALFGVAMLYGSKKLPETAKSIDRGHLKIPAIIEGYKSTLRNRILVLCSLMMGCGGALIYIFGSKAPFIGINIVGLKPGQFGLYNLIPPIGLIIGSFAASALIGRLSTLQALFWTTLGMVLANFTMLIPFAIYGPSSLSLFVPMALIYIFAGIGYPNMSSYGLSTATNKSNASAVFNFLNIGTVVLSVLLSELIYPASALAMPLFFLFFLLLMLYLWSKLKNFQSISS